MQMGTWRRSNHFTKLVKHFYNRMTCFNGLLNLETSPAYQSGDGPHFNEVLPVLLMTPSPSQPALTNRSLLPTSTNPGAAGKRGVVVMAVARRAHNCSQGVLTSFNLPQLIVFEFL